LSEGALGPDVTREPRTLEELQRTHRPPPVSRLRIPRAEADEQSAVRNYVRDLILGFSDGLVSVYAAVAGVAAAVLARDDTASVLVAGLAFGVAGALSMGLGEYLSTKSQAEYYAAEAAREREHIRKYRDLEEQEVREMLSKKGYPADVVETLTRAIVEDEDRFVDFMMREEFGVGEESGRSPWIAMGLVMVAFVVGAVFPVAPFAFPIGVANALGLASVLSVAALFAAGAVKGGVSGLKWWKQGAEMTLIGVAAAAVTFAVGYVVGGVAF